MTEILSATLELSRRQAVALIFGSISVLYGAQGVFTPISFARNFGFPILSPPKTSDQEHLARSSAFVAATGGRTAALGLAIIVLALEGKTRAAGTVLASCSISGLVDTISCYNAGDSGSWIQHAIGTMVLGGLGMWLKNQA